ncbi:MAG: hypothetical protein N2C14_16745, partial [Planctomycetales bacterium]
NFARVGASCRYFNYGYLDVKVFFVGPVARGGRRRTSFVGNQQARRELAPRRFNQAFPKSPC